ncbi:MAG TPA: ABC transporter ATP-binding protein, partial [Pseudomonas sp.]|nr:ABC transporter ATP-binding protein [Pseudomonas sp.]
PGQWVRLDGRSGLGKSTLLRTLQGLWPYCRGQWQLPPGASLLLPQQPYLA